MKAQMHRPWKRSPDVLSQQVRNETVLLDLASDKYFGLDEVGGRIWRLIGEGKTVTGIVNALLEEYEVDQARLEADVSACIADLEEAGLLVPDSPTEKPGSAGGGQ
jgi:hypothetical protein